jgi:hypothetical protein
MFQKTKYIYDDNRKEFHPAVFPISLPFNDYLTSHGYEDEAQLAAAKQLYGKNK